MALKFLLLSASNVNKVVKVMRWVHISLHRAEMKGLVVRNSIDTIDTVSIPFGIVEYCYVI